MQKTFDMAYTKIIPIHNHLERCLNYTSNPNKTEVLLAADLGRTLAYTQSADKTEHQLYVTGFHCAPQSADRMMNATKQRWSKPTDKGVLGYHIIQSFAPGETTPAQAHEIGCEFARRFLADRFECTVSTHLDKGHLHNHVVINSVSYLDGKMFRNDFAAYYRGIRQVSDELCRENRLSTIVTDGKSQSYAEWQKSRKGKPTWRTLVQADVEQAIRAAHSFEGFVVQMEQMGYTVRHGSQYAHLSVRHKDAGRSVRIDNIDSRYSEQSLRQYYSQLQRMPPAMRNEYLQQLPPPSAVWPEENKPPLKARYCTRRKIQRPFRKVTGFMACYYHYCALLRRACNGRSSRKCYYLLREDFAKFYRYQRQSKLLWEHHIETMPQLLTFRYQTEAALQELLAQRRRLYRCKAASRTPEQQAHIKELTAQIKALRRNAAICVDIEADAAEVQEQLNRVRQAQKDERNEVKENEQRRRSR